MTPVTVDVPHRLGRDAAVARMKARVGELGGHLPGGMADVRHSWPEPHVMALDISAMGQAVAARLEVEEARVRVHLSLPPMLAMLTPMISMAVRQGGERLLEDRTGR